MSNSKKQNEAGKLIDLIHVENAKRKWTLRDLAGALNISYIYMTAISSGARKVSGLSFDKQRSLSKILDITMVEFFLLAGILTTDDFPT